MKGSHLSGMMRMALSMAVLAQAGSGHVQGSSALELQRGPLDQMDWEKRRVFERQRVDAAKAKRERKQAKRSR
ncbi:hypothetical protein [Hymenobacter koreensis]|uniref:Uncharacterized protein n=1 Tax=Hymenobacter koreensis TaxID=1084523 RepID=A0ABP8JL15_9BACT